MALLYHEIEVEFPESREMEKHQAILLGFGKTEKGRTISAMALTVGVPAAIGALVHLSPSFLLLLCSNKHVNADLLPFLLLVGNYSSCLQTRSRQEVY